MIQVNKIENKTTFKTKAEFYFELLTPENGENVPDLETTEVVLIHYNIVNNGYQKNSRALCTFVPKKSFGQLLNIPPKHFMFLKSFKQEVSFIEVQFTDQHSKPLEIEVK